VLEAPDKVSMAAVALAISGSRALMPERGLGLAAVSRRRVRSASAASRTPDSAGCRSAGLDTAAAGRSRPAWRSRGTAPLPWPRPGRCRPRRPPGR